MKKQVINISMRPLCIHPGCNNRGQHMGNYRKDGTPIFRKYCTKHHHERQAEKKGLTSNQWLNSFHPYLQFRKDYCENKDSRLGFKCNYKIRFSGLLQVDHKNGNPTDNRPSNLQTLCANCHIFKTFENKDYKSPGRKYFKYNQAA